MCIRVKIEYLRPRWGMWEEMKRGERVRNLCHHRFPLILCCSDSFPTPEVDEDGTGLCPSSLSFVHRHHSFIILCVAITPTLYRCHALRSAFLCLLPYMPLRRSSHILANQTPFLESFPNCVPSCLPKKKPVFHSRTEGKFSTSRKKKRNHKWESRGGREQIMEE